MNPLVLTQPQASSQSKIDRSKHENCVKNLVFLFMLNKIASSKTLLRTLILLTGIEPELHFNFQNVAFTDRDAARELEINFFKSQTNIRSAEAC